MSYLYIEPKYNSGERVAGGTLTIWVNEEQLNTIPLYSTADLDNAYQIANPVPIDNNGVNSSAIFLDLDEYQEAYYVLKDSKGAIIREGLIYPCLGGGNGSSFNTGIGEPFWGYEIIESIPELAQKSTLIGRPVWLRTTTVTGDRSSGLVVYAVQGSANDGILSFTGNNGRYWKAREEYIDYSYLKGALGTTEVFGWLEANYKGQYKINLDVLPSEPAQAIRVDFSSKIKISKQLSGNYTQNYNALIIYLSAENLEFLVNNPFQMSGTPQGQNPFPLQFAINGGSWNTSNILDNNYYSPLIGSVDSLHLNTNGLKTGGNLKIKSLKRQSNVISSSTNRLNPSEMVAYVDTIDSSVFWALNVNVSSLNTLQLKKLIVDGNSCNLFVDDDLKFAVDNKSGHGCSLSMNPQNSYYIKPAKKAFIPDNSVKANNADFYNNLAGVHSNVGIATQIPTGGSIPNVTANNLLKLESNCKGTVILDDVNTNKLYVASGFVSVIGQNRNQVVYLKEADRIVGVNVIIERQLDQYTFTDLQSNNRNAYYCNANEISKCDIIAGTSYSPWSEGNDIIFLENATIKECNFYNKLHTIVLNKVKMSGCSLYTSNNPSGNVGVPTFNSIYAMGNGISITDCLVWGVYCGLWGAGDGLNYKNIHFDNNKAMAQTTYLDLFASDSPMKLNRVMPSNDSNNTPFIVENVTFKGNNHNGNETYAFIPMSTSRYALQNPLIKGHIEITGYYDYTMLQGVLPTEKFPPEGKNFYKSGNNAKFWEDGGEYIDSICMYQLGDPLKYGNRDGVFIVTDDSYVNTTPETSSKLYKTEHIKAKLNMAVDAWDDVGNGYTKVIRCLLCCNCNVQLYRIRE